MPIINPKSKENLAAELKFRTTRVRVYVWLGKDPKPIEGYAFVSDVKKKAVSGFFSRRFPMGDIALVGFENHSAKPFRAKVMGNKSVADDKHGIPKEKYTWKSQFEFAFASEDESKLYSSFFQDLRSRTAAFAKAVEQPEYKITEKDPKADPIDDINLDGSNSEGDKGAA